MMIEDMARLEESAAERRADEASRMTKREHFAAIAMQGIVGAAMHIPLADDGLGGTIEDRIARRAVRCADALVMVLKGG